MDQQNRFYIEEINDLATKDTNLLITMGEQMYHSQIFDVTTDIIRHNDVKVVLVAGPSSSGKTTTSILLAESLKEYGKNSVVVSLDDFFLNRENTPILPNGNYDFENITALDLVYFNKFIDELLKNHQSLMPTFDFVSGHRKEELTKLAIDDNTIIIIEGLHALNPSLIQVDKKYLYKIYIKPSSDFYNNDKILIPHKQVRQMRRIIRDLFARGRSVLSTLNSWQDVLDGEIKYIDPFKENVDAKIDSTHIYEPLMYAKHLLPILDKEDKQNPQILKLINMLSPLYQIDKSNIPEGSLLNEFLNN